MPVPSAVAPRGLFSSVLVGLLTLTLALLPAVSCLAGEQAERAVAAVKQLIASGKVRPGAVIRLNLKQGNIAAFMGRDNELKDDWERATGILLDTVVVPQLASREYIRKARDVDITIARNHEYPDLLDEGLIEDLTPLLQKFGFSLPEDTTSGYILLRQQAYLGDRVVAIPADLDVQLIYLRKDLLEDPAEGRRFRNKYGRDPDVPKTWKEYTELVSFFNRPQEGVYGALEPREKLTAWMYWFPRYAAFAAPGQYLFDERMKPLIDSPAGVAATESWLATIPFSPQEVSGEGKDYNYTLPYFLRGKGFSTLITPAGAKIANLEQSAIKGKVIAAPLPGRFVGDRLLRRSTIMYGNNLVLPRSGKNKELAFLYAMWQTDPDNSIRSVLVSGGFADPYRYNHLTNAEIRKVYSPQALDALRAALPDTLPAGTGLPGDAEYLAALGQQLWLAATGSQSAGQAMARTAHEWEAITERLGREQQIAHWKSFRKNFPGVVNDYKAR
ncbi:extracellular solute-binding protein [Accumulibacter sp.]|uniref:extracellular solute-binding protein n=1 Tax=Accumulibacter sp. TaxID=2053492 RepID=UPI002612F30B|nr:extracellular solute-binding protein [Accumulibacter sp.]